MGRGNLVDIPRHRRPKWREAASVAARGAQGQLALTEDALGGGGGENWRRTALLRLAVLVSGLKHRGDAPLKMEGMGGGELAASASAPGSRRLFGDREKGNL